MTRHLHSRSGAGDHWRRHRGVCHRRDDQHYQPQSDLVLSAVSAGIHRSFSDDRGSGATVMVVMFISVLAGPLLVVLVGRRARDIATGEVSAAGLTALPG